jgi:hypothetical protein
LSLSESTISCRLKFASEARGALGGRRAWMKAFSRSVRNFAVSGTVEWSVSYLPRSSGMVDSQSGNKKMTATPNTTVTRPSKRKRYCHPLKPCEPEIVSKAYARSPLQTPERLPKISEGQSVRRSSVRSRRRYSQKYRSLIDSSSGRYQYVS